MSRRRTPADIRAQAQQRAEEAGQAIECSGDHLGLTGQVAEYLRGRNRTTVGELLERFPVAHPAPVRRMAQSLREVGWRPVTGQAHRGRARGYWTPIRPSALWRRIWPLIKHLTGKRGRRRPCVPVDVPAAPGQSVPPSP
jgi:hypothetical protein